MVLNRPLTRFAGLAVILCGLASGFRSAAAAEGGALRLTAARGEAGAARLREGGAAWSAIPTQVLHLNRTPPLYEGDPLDDGFRPAARVSLAFTGQGLLIRLTWSDSTESRPLEPEKFPDAGAPPIYKQHSQDIQRFADAACVMIPKTTGDQDSFPSLMMGNREAPVDLYYWNAVKGFEVLEAAGRATTSRTGKSFPGTAHYAGNEWEVIFEIPAISALTPVSFALWDGERGQRDGLKYYSLWHEVSP